MASYQQNPKSKLWSVRFRDINDKGMPCMPRLSGFRTKREAQEAYRAHINKQEAEKCLKKAPGVERMLFDDLVNRYLDAKEINTKGSTQYTYESKINNHIRPYFKGKYADEITLSDVLEWQKSISKYSYKYKTDLQGRLTSIYIFGARYHGITNIMRDAEKFRKTESSPKMQFWTKEQFLTFAGHCEDRMYSALFWLLYITGARKGEILSLSDDDICFNARKVNIDKNLTRKTKKAPWEVTSTKNTPSERIIEIPQKVCDLLKAYKEQRGAFGAFFFGGERPLAERTVDRRFHDTIEKAGVPKIRIHDLRHSCASLLISEGVPIIAVSKRLGHKDIKETLDTYSHMMPEDNEKLLAVLDGI